MKKCISLFLVFAMVLSLSSVSLAADNVQMEPELLEEYDIDTGTYYRYVLNYTGDEWDAIIFVPNDDERAVSFTATQITPLMSEAQNGVDDGIYSLTIDQEVNKDPLEYLQEGFDLLDQASVISVTSFDTSVEVAEPRDSVQADLFRAAREIYGDESEHERVLYSDYTYPDVDVISVHQDLVLRLVEKGSLTFAAGTSLSVVALAMGNLTGFSVLLSTASIVVSVVGEYLDAIAEVDAYIVRVDFGRWTTINNGDEVYTITNKVYRHCAFNERNNEREAYLQPENPELSYDPSSTYYYDYGAQVEDAYDMYLRINR